jgi:hypothetical protein
MASAGMNSGGLNSVLLQMSTLRSESPASFNPATLFLVHVSTRYMPSTKLGQVQHNTSHPVLFPGGVLHVVHANKRWTGPSGDSRLSASAGNNFLALSKSIPTASPVIFSTPYGVNSATPLSLFFNRTLYFTFDLFLLPVPTPDIWMEAGQPLNPASLAY